MRNVSFRKAALLLAALASIFVSSEAGSAGDDASPIFGVRLPAGYRDWQVVSVAHEAGTLNDIRAVLANDVAMKAYRDKVRPFPDGAVIARVAWAYVPSAENDAIFGRPQSFVAGAPTNIQLSVKDSKKYASTSGWGFGQYEGGHVNHSETLMQTCLPCHARAPKSADFVFTHYAP